MTDHQVTGDEEEAAGSQPSGDDTAGAGAVQARLRGRPVGVTHPDASGLERGVLPPVPADGDHQKQVEARVLDALESVPKRLNISRRQFLTTSAGLAASFVALNEVFRDYAFGETLFRVGKEADFDHDAFLADGPPSDLFVFDDQCHLVRGAPRSGARARALLVLAQGDSARLPNSPFLSNPWNPQNHRDEHGRAVGELEPGADRPDQPGRHRVLAAELHQVLLLRRARPPSP